MNIQNTEIKLSFMNWFVVKSQQNLIGFFSIRSTLLNLTETLSLSFDSASVVSCRTFPEALPRLSEAVPLEKQKVRTMTRDTSVVRGTGYASGRTKRIYIDIYLKNGNKKNYIAHSVAIAIHVTTVY